MTVAALLTLDCTITHRAPSGAKDAFGDEQTTETPISTVCELQQRQRTEQTAGGELSDTQWLLVVPAGTTIATGDTVTADDKDFEVHGEPWTVRNPRTSVVSHIEATLRRITGTTDAGS